MNGSTREYFCSTCQTYRPVWTDDPTHEMRDIVCAECHLILVTFREAASPSEPTGTTPSATPSTNEPTLTNLRLTYHPILPAPSPAQVELDTLKAAVRDYLKVKDRQTHSLAEIYEADRALRALVEEGTNG